MVNDRILRLRAFEPKDDLLRERLASPMVAGEWNTFDEDPEQSIGGQQYEGGGRIIDSEGMAVGSVSFIRVPYGPTRRSLAWRIGIVVLPEHRRRGVGSAAQRMLAMELLAASDANRVEADTDVHNIAEQRALENAGFQREGVLRGAQWRKGGWHDSALYAVLRADI